MSADKNLQEEMKNFLLTHYNKMGNTEIAKLFMQQYSKMYTLPNQVDIMRKRFGRLRKSLNLPSFNLVISNLTNNIPLPPPQPVITVSPLEIFSKKSKDKDKIVKLLKSSEGYSVEDLSKKLNEKSDYIQYILDEIVNEGYDYIIDEDKYFINTEARQGGHKVINLEKFENKIYKFGVVADTHLNSKFERLDILNSLYDIFEKEKITTVLHGGNWIDGEAKFNKHDLINHGMTKQINYFIKNYPQRKGIKTLIISGDDHEGWYWSREGINIGEYLEMKAAKAGRKDLINLGYVEADIDLKASEGIAKMRVMHGGGGTAYAMSYTPQKMIESFQGGEKPAILLLGHYHKADYMFYRDVHCLQLGTTQNQTTFMRKKKIQAHMGGWIIEFQQSKDGAINRFKSEWIPFFNENYYERNIFYKE